jgi:hypothetical protein
VLQGGSWEHNGNVCPGEVSRAEDGRIAYRMKRPLPDGTTHLLFTGLELLRRLASLLGALLHRPMRVARPSWTTTYPGPRPQTRAQ